jgi:glycosyltransferase involved in cell wall biosynthesis
MSALTPTGAPGAAAALTLTVIVPGRLDTRTGGYEYDRRIIAGLRDRGWLVDVRELDGPFPHPTSAALAHAARVLAAIPDGTCVLIDGLACGLLPAEVEREASRLKIVALVHLPLAAEIGLDRETAARLALGERRALAAARRIVVTGRSTVDALAQYGVARDRIAVVEPGTERAPLSHGSTGPPVHLLSVGAITAGKGHEILFRALEAIPRHDWRLTCAGSLERDPSTVERLRAWLRASGVQDRVSLAGELDGDALEVFYDSADVFVLATLHETYCMAVAEALAHGLPVVSTTTGAIPELVGASGNGGQPAGLLVPPGDVEAMTAALSTLVGNARAREQFAEGARRVRDRLPTWDEVAEKMAAALNDVS